MHHRLAKRDQLQRLDELPARDVLTEKATGTGHKGRQNVTCSVRTGKNDCSQVRILRDHPAYEVIGCGPAFVDTHEPDANSRRRQKILGVFIERRKDMRWPKGRLTQYLAVR
jgi:hypothetical protein